MGLPEIIIEFKTKGVTAIKRSARGIVAIGLPVGNWFAGYLEVITLGYTFKITITSANTGITYTNTTYDGKWIGWKELATTMPPQEYDVPFASGFETYPTYGSKYFKNHAGEVTLNFLVKRSDDESIHSEAIFGTLPVGFRPGVIVVQPVLISLQDHSRTGGGYIEVHQDGRLRFATDQATVHDFGCSITYLASS